MIFHFLTFLLFENHAKWFYSLRKRWKWNEIRHIMQCTHMHIHLCIGIRLRSSFTIFITFPSRIISIKIICLFHNNGHYCATNESESEREGRTLGKGYDIEQIQSSIEKIRRTMEGMLDHWDTQRQTEKDIESRIRWLSLFLYSTYRHISLWISESRRLNHSWCRQEYVSSSTAVSGVWECIS